MILKNQMIVAAIALMMMFSVQSYSQIGVTGYGLRAIGVNTSQENTISGELKLFANRDFRNVLTELDLFYNFDPRTYHRFSLGIGINGAPFREFDNLYAITIPVQLEVFPLQNFKRLSLMLELTPEVVIDSDMTLRSLWGIRYTFGE